MVFNNYVPVIALLLVVALIVFLQYQLGVRRSSVRMASVLPISYSILFTVLTVVVGGWQMEAILFVVSQWLVGYWFYFIYEFGRRSAKEAVTETKREYVLQTDKNDK